MPTIYAINEDLAADLASHLEYLASGGIATPELAAQLLNRLKKATARRGFMPTEEDQPDLYKDAPPPAA